LEIALRYLDVGSIGRSACSGKLKSSGSLPHTTEKIHLSICFAGNLAFDGMYLIASRFNLFVFLTGN